MASNLTIEAPNFEKIQKEAGQFTADAISLLWAALNDTRKAERVDFRRAKDILAPKALTLSPSAQVDDLDLAGASMVIFEGGSAQSVTGFKAPETGQNRILFVLVIGAGTITLEHAHAGSEAANRISAAGGADVTLATGGGIILAYADDLWREIA